MSNKKIIKLGSNVERTVFGKTKHTLPIFDLIDVQRDAFDYFLKKGIDNTLREIFPIESSKQNIRLEFLGKRIEKSSLEYESVLEAKQKGKNYSGKLFAKLRVINQETGETKTDEVLFGDIPLMTQGGSFIINGSEKVIVSQLVRSPGVFFEMEKPLQQHLVNKCSIMPSLGAWIEVMNRIVANPSKDSKDSSIKVMIDKKGNIPLTTFLRSFGLTKDAILELYGNSDIIKRTFAKEKHKTEEDAIQAIYKILRPGDRPNKNSIKELYPNLLFNKRRYNLNKTGRYMLNKKLNLIDRIANTYLAEDLKTSAGKTLFKKDLFITNEIATQIQEAFDSKQLKRSSIPSLDFNIYSKQLELTPKLKKATQIIRVNVYKNSTDPSDINIVIGNDSSIDLEFITVPDIIASVSYFINISNGLGREDDVDSLRNKRIRTIGELLENQLRIGLTRMEINAKERMSARDTDKITPKGIINNKPISNAFSSFFNTSQLAQFMDQINPLAEVSNKRRVTSLGPGGLSRETAKFDVRDVHFTHYGRLCPIETPEGPNIGLILNFSIYSKVNEYGFVETPYFPVNNGKVDYTNPIYLAADQEEGKYISQSSITVDKNNKITDEFITVRRGNEYKIIKPEELNYVDVASNQLASIASSAIPFLENDDANRTLMGANMQRQAVPLIQSESPYVATGIESAIAKYSPTNIRASKPGVVSFVDSTEVKIKDEKGRTKTYKLRTFERSNQGSLISQKPIVKIGDKISEDQLLTDGSSFDNGELAIGKNALVAFSTWNGFNFEDAIIISERLVKDDVYTSIHVEQYDIQFRKSKIGNDIMTTEIPNVSNFAKRWLASNGIIRIGSEVIAGDVLVGRTSPKGEETLTPEQKLVAAIFSEKSKANKDTSLKVKHGQGGTVIDVEVLSRENGDKLDDGVEQIVKVYIAQKRKIKVGDKMAGRHGNKGVISRVLPVEDMPHLEDGTPVDIMLNPLGVPSRMNIGQVLELHLGMAAKTLNIKYATPIFDGATVEDINNELKLAKLPESGKFKLIDPITGKAFDNDVAVGVMYMLKLSHMVDDKMHARSIGPYSLITQQPLGGKSQNGGQRFGEMEVWALEAYGASNILQEMLTYKSDDIVGRNRLYKAISSNEVLPRPGTPESFNVLSNELRGLGINPIRIYKDEYRDDAYQYDFEKAEEEIVDEFDEDLLKFRDEEEEF